MILSESMGSCITILLNDVINKNQTTRLWYIIEIQFIYYSHIKYMSSVQTNLTNNMSLFTRVLYIGKKDKKKTVGP